MSKNAFDPQGKPLGCDFITFRVASCLSLAGRAHDAYDIASLFNTGQIAVAVSLARDRLSSAALTAAAVMPA